jgi:thymidylate synthase (FAD)
MRVVDPSTEILTPLDGEAALAHIERCGRVCYKSEGRAAPGTARAFVAGIIKRGHESVLEHVSATVRFVCDRGVTHEIVRHRLASYSQESTRYCNYQDEKFGQEITVVRPPFFAEGSPAWEAWAAACQRAEEAYFQLIALGHSPQEARAALPSSLKAELVMTANLREWRHFFRLRAAAAAHPQMREVVLPLLARFQAAVPVIFDDLLPETPR